MPSLSDEEEWSDHPSMPSLSDPTIERIERVEGGRSMTIPYRFFTNAEVESFMIRQNHEIEAILREKIQSEKCSDIIFAFLYASTTGSLSSDRSDTECISRSRSNSPLSSPDTHFHESPIISPLYRQCVETNSQPETTQSSFPN